MFFYDPEDPDNCVAIKPLNTLFLEIVDVLDKEAKPVTSTIYAGEEYTYVTNEKTTSLKWCFWIDEQDRYFEDDYIVQIKATEEKEDRKTNFFLSSEAKKRKDKKVENTQLLEENSILSATLATETHQIDGKPKEVPVLKVKFSKWLDGEKVCVEVYYDDREPTRDRDKIVVKGRTVAATVQGDTDFYNEKGEYLGNNGKEREEGRIIIVTDRRIANRVLDNEVTLEDIPPNIQYELPPYSHRQEIKAIVEDMDDNNYEVGGLGYFLNTHDDKKDVGLKKTVHVRAADGKKFKEGEHAAHILLSDSFIKNLPHEFLDTIEKGDRLRRRIAYRWHSHPTMKKTVDDMNGMIKNGTKEVYVLGEQPSYIDIENAEEVHNNFVVFDDTIHFYDQNTEHAEEGTGSSGSIKSKLFFNLKQGDANSRKGR